MSARTGRDEVEGCVGAAAKRAGAGDAEGPAKQLMLLLTGALWARPGPRAREAAVVVRMAAEAVLARGLG